MNKDYNIDLTLKIAPSPLDAFVSTQYFPNEPQPISMEKEKFEPVENKNIKIKIENVQSKIKEVFKKIDEGKDGENKIYDLFIIKDHF